MKNLLPKNELKRQTFRCGGKGGQNVNKVETGVRYIHIPSGISAESCQERTQGKNDEIAFTLLIDKIVAAVEEKQEQIKQEEYNKKPEVAFGRQIRTYWLCGQQRVVDHRTNVRAAVNKVLDGMLDELLRAEIKGRN